jgi:hypothetical protein
MRIFICSSAVGAFLIANNVFAETSNLNEEVAAMISRLPSASNCVQPEAEKKTIALKLSGGSFDAAKLEPLP